MIFIGDLTNGGDYSLTRLNVVLIKRRSLCSCANNAGRLSRVEFTALRCLDLVEFVLFYDIAALYFAATV